MDIDRKKESSAATNRVTIDYVAIGKRIRKMRKHLSMTQADLGHVTGKSTSFIGHIERGTRIASLETVLQIALALDITIDALITGIHRLSMQQDETWKHSNSIHEMRMLNDIIRVLSEHKDQWMQQG